MFDNLIIGRKQNIDTQERSELIFFHLPLLVLIVVGKIRTYENVQSNKV